MMIFFACVSWFNIASKMVSWRKLKQLAAVHIICEIVFLYSILYIVFAFVFVHGICEEDRLLAQNKAAVHMGPSLHYPCICICK